MNRQKAGRRPPDEKSSPRAAREYGPADWDEQPVRRGAASKASGFDFFEDEEYSGDYVRPTKPRGAAQARAAAPKKRVRDDLPPELTGGRPLYPPEYRERVPDERPARKKPPAYEDEAPVRKKPRGYDEEVPARKKPPAYEDEAPVRKKPRGYDEELPARKKPLGYGEELPARKKPLGYGEELPVRKARGYADEPPARKARGYEDDRPARADRRDPYDRPRGRDDLYADERPARPRPSPARARKRKKKNAGFARGMLYLAAAGFLALLIGFGVRMFGFELVKVSGDAMAGTMKEGQIVLVDKGAYYRGKPARGDIVCVNSPEGLILRRVVALPGENIQIRDGTTYVNDEQLEEPYITRQSGGDYQLTTVPPGGYFVMSDNRLNADDSRTFGLIKNTRDLMVGKVTNVVWPFDQWGAIEQ